MSKNKNETKMSKILMSKARFGLFDFGHFDFGHFCFRIFWPSAHVCMYICTYVDIKIYVSYPNT
jgi:hypothetical protein